MAKLLEPDACDAYVCETTLPVREVLERLNAVQGLAQIVVDDNGILLGVVTDGDVRRGFLDGHDLTSPVAAVMNPKPIVGLIGDHAANRLLLRQTPSRRPFLPIVDKVGAFAGVIIGNGIERAGTTVALVMAGGFGSRLGERTRETPKPLLHVAGRPILDHVLSRLEEGGIRRIFISAHYLAEQIVAFAKDRCSSSSLNVLNEREKLGTAGAIGLLPPDISGFVIVMNGDVVSGVDVGAINEFVERHALDGAIAVARHEVAIPFGVIRHDADGHFVGIDEKPTLSHFVAAGIYVLGPEVRALVVKGEALDMPELLNLAKQAGLRIGLFPIHEYWRDVGHPGDLEAADRDIRLPVKMDREENSSRDAGKLRK